MPKKNVRKGSRLRRRSSRGKISAKFQLTEDAILDYKNVPLLQKFLNDRGKIVPRRISGVTAKKQRMICASIKKARFLALLPSGGVKK